MKPFLSGLAFLIAFASYAQSTPLHYFPVKQHAPDLSEATIAAIQRQGELLLQDKRTSEEQAELDMLLEQYGEVVESGWDVINAECSWYCGGGNYKVAASSVLTSKNKNYEAASANDLSYETAWVPDSKKGGIGESIEYFFENKSPRITSIIIANGYMKSDEAWKNNNRIKAFRLWVNGKSFGILNLTDTKTDQMFQIGTFGHNPDGSDLRLKFEILSVYPGSKYNDSAVTEIYFDGIDVH